VHFALARLRSRAPRWASLPMGGRLVESQTRAMDQRANASAQNRSTDDGGHPMTAEGLAALQEEIERLRAQMEREVARRLREARGFGDPSANDELWAIREEEAVLAARIARLDEARVRARLVLPDAGARQLATVGSVVLLEDLATHNTMRYRIVGGHEEPDNGGIVPVSVASPVGAAILGQRVGAAVEVQLPGGRARRLRLAKVEPPSGGVADAGG
jgi:transcription elongation factor GreA